MSSTVVEICNLALQRLGAARINDLTENTNNARQCNLVYAPTRDAELRRRNWRFALKRVVLAPSGTAPAFDFTYQYPIPSDCIRIIKPVDSSLDWQLESKQILTNDGPTLELRYVSRVEDPSMFDELFVEALACKMAYNMAEALTQSAQKRSDALQEYRTAIAEAARANAFETIPQDQPTDTWITARL